MNTTSVVAWWGAIIATIVLLWDIVKWTRTGPRVGITTQCHVCYPDAKVLHVEQAEHGQVSHLADYCHIEIFNTGDRATTIISIEGTHRRKKSEMQIYSGGVQFEAHHGKTLPIVLAAGEMWSARFEMDNLYRLAERGRPVILVRTSHLRRPIEVFPTIKRRNNSASPSGAAQKRAAH